MNYKQTSSSEVTLTGFELHATDNLTLSSLNRIVKSAIFLILNLDLGDAVSAVITPVAAFDVLFTKLNQKPGVTLKLSFQSWVFVVKLQTQTTHCAGRRWIALRCGRQLEHIKSTGLNLTQCHRVTHHYYLRFSTIWKQLVSRRDNGTNPGITSKLKRDCKHRRVCQPGPGIGRASR